MKQASNDPSALLNDLLSRPRPDRAAWLHDYDRLDELFGTLGAEIERHAVSDSEAAVDVAADILPLVDEVGSVRSRLRVRRAQAQALAYAGRFEDALATCHDAIAIAAQHDEAIEGARVRLASLHALANLGRFEEALTAGAIAHEAFVAAGETELAARADLNLGAIHAMRDEPAAALACFERARIAFAEQPSILAQLESNRGNALIALDDHEAAEDAFAAATAAFEHAGQPLALGIAESNRAFLAARRGRLQDALSRYERAGRLLERSASPAHVARMRAEQAGTMAALGLPAEAIEILELAIPELERLGQAAEAARSRVTHGRALIAVDRWEAAEEVLTKASRQLLALGLLNDHARVLLLLAQLALLRDSLDEARRFAVESIAAFADRPVDRALALGTMARIALAAGNGEEAEQALDEAGAIAERLQVTPLIAELSLMRGWLLNGRGSDPLPAFIAAVDATERVRDTLQASRFRSAFHADRMAPYTQLLSAALRSDCPLDLAVAFRAAELIKSRGLLDVVGSEIAQESPDQAQDELSTRLLAVRTELNWRYSRLDEQGGVADRVDSLRELEREHERIESRIATSRATPVPSSPPTPLDELIDALGSGSAAISYVFNGDNLTAFVIRDGKCTARRTLATFGEIHDAARRLRFQISRAQAKSRQRSAFERTAADVTRELGALWSMLIEPLQGELTGAERLIVAPHSLLHTVPFAALWDGSHYLIEQAQVSVVPSLSLFSHLPKEHSTGGATSAVIGSPDDLTQEIAGEVNRVATALDTDRLSVGANATAAQAIRDLESAQTVHLACHGRFVRDHPHASGLKLADRWLTLSEISALRLPASHVTLSACDTGRFSVQAADELVGLVSGFYAAGARSLIYTLWPVDDAGSNVLMAACYRRHREGVTFPEALRAAQKQLIAGNAHPALWAPFVFGGTA